MNILRIDSRYLIKKAKWLYGWNWICLRIFQVKIAPWSATGFVCGDSKFNSATLRFANGPLSLSHSGNFGQRQHISNSYPESQVDTFGKALGKSRSKWPPRSPQLASWCRTSSGVCWVCSVNLKCYCLHTAQQAVSLKHHHIPELLYFAILISNLHIEATTFFTPLLPDGHTSRYE